MTRHLFVLLVLFSIQIAGVRSYASDPEKMASALIQAKSDSEVDALLRTSKKQLNAALCKTLLLQGDQIRENGDVPKAVFVYQTAQKIAQQIGDRTGIADALNHLATAYDYLGNLDLKSQAAQDGLKISQDLKYQRGIADSLLTIGSIEENGGKYAEAMESYQKSYAIYEKLNDKVGLGTCFNSMGIVFTDQGNYEKAEDYYEKALNLRKEVGDKGKIAVTLNEIAANHYSLGNFSKAIQYFNESLKQFESIGDKRQIAVLTFNIGAVYDVWGNYRSALEYAQRAIRMTEEMGIQKNLNLMVLGLGSLYREIGDYDEALKFDQRGLELSEKMGDKHGMGDAYCHMANAYAEKGNYSLAVNHGKSCLDIRQSAGLKDQLPDALGDLGKIYLRQGNQELALKYFQQGLAMAQDLGQQQAVAHILSLRGYSYFLAADFAHAAEDYGNALTKSQTQNSRPEIASTLRNLGEVKLAQGKLEESLDYFQKSMNLWEEMDSQNEMADTLRSLSQLSYERSDYSKSLEYSDRSAKLAEKIHSPEVLWQALTMAGKSQQALNRLEEAQHSFDRAIEVIDTLRLQVAGGEENEQQFFENKLEPYDHMIALLYDQKKFDEALVYAEREKARVLADVLKEGKIQISKAMTAVEQQEEEESILELVSLNTQIRNESQRKQPDLTILSDLNLRLEKARSEYEAFRAALYVAHPELKMQRANTPPSGKQDFEALLHSKNEFLEYVVTDNHTFLFVIRKDQDEHPNLKVYRIEITRAELARKIEQFRHQLSERDPGFASLAVSIYNLLVHPAEADLEVQNTLILVPDRELWGLPFQALMNGRDSYLGDQNAISYASSLTVLRDMRHILKQSDAVKTGPTILAFGNPSISLSVVERAAFAYRDQKLTPLPETEKEVIEIQKLYWAESPKIYTGDFATESNWKKESEKFKILHLATHGILNSSTPLYSHVVLSHPETETREDGLLEAWEIMQMNLSADLVVLSACETALGRIGAGEGMIGLSWAFFVAGSRATIVSQWKVESESTTQLMLAFYKNLRRGISKPESLRRAARSVSSNSRYRHPFYWAGFVIIGDPS